MMRNLGMATVVKATYTTIFLLLSILPRHAKAEKWKLNDESAEDDSPAVKTFLEHVLQASEEINWIKKVVHYDEKEGNREQCLQYNSNPFSSSDNIDRFDSDNENLSDIQAQNIGRKDGSLDSSGKDFSSDSMYDSDQTRSKSKNAGERFKRGSSDQLDKDPELKNIGSNIDNLHILDFPPELTEGTGTHELAEIHSFDSKEDSAVKRRGTGQIGTGDDELTTEEVAQLRDPSDSVMEAYFAEHGRGQGSRGRSATEAHSRDVRVDVPEPLTVPDVLKTKEERSEQEHQRLQLEDADGLLKDKRVESPIGSIDNQMALDKEKNAKQANKIKFRTVPLQETKIARRDNQSQEHGLLQQIKLDLLNDPLYNKVDLKTMQKVNIGNDKSEKNLVPQLVTASSPLENNLLSSVHQSLASDQQKLDTLSNEAADKVGAHTFLNKKDASGHQTMWNEPAATPKQSPISVQISPYEISNTKDAGLSMASENNSNKGSNEKEPIRLSRSNCQKPCGISVDDSHPEMDLDSSSQERDQLLTTNRGLQQISRDKRTVVKRPGAIWQNNVGNEDLDGSESEGVSEEEPDSENEGKGPISFESDENDINNSIASGGNVALSKSSSAEKDSAMEEVEESNKEANEEKSERKGDSGLAGESSNDVQDQMSAVEIRRLEDIARLKDSYKFSSQFAPPLEANGIQEPEDNEKISDTDDSHLVRNERAAKESNLNVDASAKAADKEHEISPDEFSMTIDGRGQEFIQRYKGSELERNNRKQESREHIAEENPGDLINNDSHIYRKRNKNPLSVDNSHSSRSLLSVFEPQNTMQDADVQNYIKLAHTSRKRSLTDEEVNAGFWSEPLDKIIDRELHNGNLPPLIRVKRSGVESDFGGKPAEVASDDRVPIHLSVKPSAVDGKIDVQHTNDQKSCHGIVKRSDDREKPVKTDDNSGESIFGNVKQSAVDGKPERQSGNDWKSVGLNAKQAAVNGKPANSASDQESLRVDVKRSVVEADLNGEQAEGSADDPEAVIREISGTARAKRICAHSKRDHGRGKGPIVSKGSSKDEAGGKECEKCSYEINSDWKDHVRSTKHARRNQEDEDEKEFESTDLNNYSKNVTKLYTGQEKIELDSRNMEANAMDDGGLISPRYGQVEKSEDENDNEYSSNPQGKDYDVVRRHVQHSFEKRHPASKDSRQGLNTKIKGTSTGDEEKIEAKITRNAVNQYVSKEEKLGCATDKLSEDRYKRAVNYDGAVSENLKSKLVSTSVLSSNGLENANGVRNNKNVLFNSNLQSPYENAKKMENPNIDFILGKNTLKQYSTDSYVGPVANQLFDSSKGEALQGFGSSKSGQLQSVHEMPFDITKLYDYPAYGPVSKVSILGSDGNSGNKNLFSVNDKANEQYPRGVENKCETSTPTTKPSVPTSQCPSRTSSCAAASEGQSDRRRGIINAPKPNQLDVSDEYKGELDDGHLGTEIVQAILQQVDKTPCLKQRFGSGLSVRYQPSDIKETKESNCRSQQMMHQLTQVFDQSVDEEMKSRACSPLPGDLEEFITWLMKSETRPASSTENALLVQSSCQNGCSKAPAPRHLEEPAADVIEKKIALLDQLICEYNKLDECDQEEKKDLFDLLSALKPPLTMLLKKVKSRSSGKEPTCTKKSGCDYDLDQQRRMEETMDSVGLGPKAMHSSNIGDKFISGMSMVDGSSESLSDADGTSVARRSVDEKRGSRLQRSSRPSRQHHQTGVRGNSVHSQKSARDAAGTRHQALDDSNRHDGFLSFENSKNYIKLMARAEDVKREKRYTFMKKKAPKKKYLKKDMKKSAYK